MTVAGLVLVVAAVAWVVGWFSGAAAVVWFSGAP